MQDAPEMVEREKVLSNITVFLSKLLESMRKLTY